MFIGSVRWLFHFANFVLLLGALLNDGFSRCVLGIPSGIYLVWFAFNRNKNISERIVVFWTLAGLLIVAPFLLLFRWQSALLYAGIGEVAEVKAPFLVYLANERFNGTGGYTYLGSKPDEQSSKYLDLQKTYQVIVGSKWTVDRVFPTNPEFGLDYAYRFVSEGRVHSFWVEQWDLVDAVEDEKGVSVKGWGRHISFCEVAKTQLCGKTAPSRPQRWIVAALTNTLYMYGLPLFLIPKKNP